MLSEVGIKRPLCETDTETATEAEAPVGERKKEKSQSLQEIPQQVNRRYYLDDNLHQKEKKQSNHHVKTSNSYFHAEYLSLHYDKSYDLVEHDPKKGKYWLRNDYELTPYETKSQETEDL
jgi:hypothetical protein